MTLAVDAPDADGVVAELWRDGALVDSAVIARGAASFTRPVSGAVERHRVELTRDGGRITVTSHVYVEGDPSLAPDDGCGCGTAGGAGPGLALAVLGLARRRRHRRRRT